MSSNTYRMKFEVALTNSDFQTAEEIREAIFESTRLLLRMCPTQGPAELHSTAAARDLLPLPHWCTEPFCCDVDGRSPPLPHHEEPMEVDEDVEEEEPAHNHWPDHDPNDCPLMVQDCEECAEIFEVRPHPFHYNVNWDDDDMEYNFDPVHDDVEDFVGSDDGGYCSN